MATKPNLVIKTPSVGSVTKKILSINPDLDTQRIIAIIRESIQTQGSLAGEFASAEVIDEGKALRLAHESVLC
jgi:hypothetical protein